MAINLLETKVERPPEIDQKEKTARLEEELRRIVEAKEIDPIKLERDLQEATEILQNEKEKIRPRDTEGRGGGLIELKKDIPTLVLHDIHGQREYLLKAMLEKDESGRSNLEKMMRGELQVVCLGDALHTELGGARERWLGIQKEARNNFEFSPYMDAEMADSFGAANMIMKLKIASPEHFHYLRGNHDDIEELRLSKFHIPLNRPVRQYLAAKYPPDFIKRYHAFEENLPYAAVGKGFVLSHAEPMEEYTRNQIINIKKHPHLAQNFIWTRDWQAATAEIETGDDATKKTLRNLLPQKDAEKAVWLGGHTPTANPKIDFETGTSGRFIRFYNPGKMNVALVQPETPFSPEKDIHDVSRIEIEREAIPESSTIEGKGQPQTETRDFKEGHEVNVLVTKPDGTKELQPGWKIVGRHPESKQLVVQYPPTKYFRFVTEEELAKWNKK